MPLPTNPRRVDMSSTRRSQPSALTRTLDAMEVEPHGEWFELGEGMGNHIPAQLKYAQRRHPGREYVWEYDDIGVRVWRVA